MVREGRADTSAEPTSGQASTQVEVASGAMRDEAVGEAIPGEVASGEADAARREGGSDAGLTEDTAARGRWGRLVDRALLGREDPTALGLLRVALVAVFTANMLAHVGSVAEYFSDASPLFGEWAREAFPTRWSLFFYVESAPAVQAIFGLGVVAHILWLVGLYTRPAAIVAVVVWVSMVGRNPLLYSMPDNLITALSMWLALLPSGRGLSLDARWRGKGGPVPVWCRRLLQLQVAVVYTGTGLLKSGVTWREGTAIYYSLVNPYNRHFAVSGFLAMIQPYVLRPITWAVLVWEVGFGGFVLLHWLREATGWRRIPDLRRAFLGFGAAMHLGIQSMLFVVWFTPLMLGSYFAFLRPDEAKRLVAWVRRRIGRSPAPQARASISEV